MRRGGLWKSLFCFFVMVPMVWGTTVFAAEIKVPSQYSEIQPAIDAAAPGDVILVATGTYVGNLLVQKAITIKKEKEDDHCVIDGGNVGRGVTFSGADASGAVLSGFTITGGNADLGGGISCAESSPTIIACSIVGNQAEMGGGVYLDYYSSPTFFSCLIAENLATFAGGGFFCSFESSPEIVNCTVSNNSAPSGDSEGYGGGILAYYLCSPFVSNSILWGNEAAIGPEIYLYNSSIAIDHSDVRGGQFSSNIYIDPSAPSEVQWGQGNIGDDPLFADEGNYHLSPDSPCIDAGITLDGLSCKLQTDLFEFDIEGEPRVMGFAPDMGADEVAAEEDTTISVVIDIKPGCSQNKINLKSWGLLPVAVKTTKDFDVRNLDPMSVEFAGARPVWRMRYDVDRDRDKDMLFFFRIRSLALDEESTDATLTGKTKEGKAFKGSDKVSIEKPKLKAKAWRFGRR